MTSAAVPEPIAALAALGPDVRYVALYRDGTLQSWQRDDLADASASESDRYEELLVNPTLLTLARQRGEIDCGGLQYLIVRYGHFFQVVVPTDRGHVSVALEPTADPRARADSIIRLLAHG